MSANPSLRAQLADLLGDDPFAAPREQRPSVAEALRDCAPGQVVPARHRGRDVALFVLADGRVFVAPDSCPHDGGRLSDGFVDGDHLVCARHGWEFEACTGRCPARDAGIAVRQLGRKRGR